MGDAGLVVIPLIVACSTFGAANASVFVVGRYAHTCTQTHLHNNSNKNKRAMHIRNNNTCKHTMYKCTCYTSPVYQ